MHDTREQALNLSDADNTELSVKPAINTLAQGSMFWQPDYLERSAWLAHLPALFWLVEALKPQQCVTLGINHGVAHFALCQAVARLHLDARCFAVQSTQTDGDAHRNQAVESLQDYHDRHYSGFSRWLDATPHGALEQVEPGSVDLLVFNVPATAEDADYLLHRWSEKLSARGVVIIPEIERREAGCQLHRVFSRWRERFPGFAFLHGEGMGIVAVGEEQPAMLQALLNTADTPAARQVVRDVFARLGRTCAESVEAHSYKTQARQLDIELGESRRQLEAMSAAYESSRSDLEARSREVAGMRQQLTHQSEQFARERELFDERADMLQEMRNDLREEVARLRDRLEAQYAQSGQAQQPVAPAVFPEALQALEQKASELESTLADKQTELDERFTELATLTRMLEEEREKNASLSGDAETTNKTLATLRQENAALKKDVEAGQVTLQRTEKERDAARSELSALKKQAETLQREADARQASIDERFRELAILTEMLEENEQQRTALERQLAEQTQELDDERAVAAQAESHTRSLVQRMVSLIEHLDEYSPSRLGKMASAEQARMMRHLALLEHTPWFDGDWYLAEYPDVALQGGMARRPALHFLLYGGFEGRNPGPLFDTRFYRERYDDVPQSGLNPLIHYLTIGLGEQRQIKADE